MANAQFIRFFDKTGVDMNLGATTTQVNVVYARTVEDVTQLDGRVYFPKVSTKLIESEQIYLLQEVTGPTSTYQLRKINGSTTTTAGNPTIIGNLTDFTSLTAGLTININNQDYTISSIGGATSMNISPTPTTGFTTDNIYRYDYLNYSYPRSTPGTFKEFLNLKFDDEYQTAFFLYNIDYTEDVPYIEKNTSISYELSDGSLDTVDLYTGRIQVSDPIIDPLQINIGMCSDDENIFEKTLIIENEKQYVGVLVDTPYESDGKLIVTISGTSQLPYILDKSVFYLQGITGSTFSTSFYEQKLEPLTIGTTGSDTYITFKYVDIPSIPVSSLTSYRLLWKNVMPFANITVYGETEGEDERFKLVLENFGRKLDFDKEYVFRDSDISESLPDFKLLNQKRKELLLEGDNIYPYIGSYKALINIINYFGYYDLDVKEYFLNVDENSPNYNKYAQVLIPKNDKQRKYTRAIWEMVPSKIWKKTSYFGLFYDLNRATDDYDDNGTPIVEDAFMFSPEEVLIKLFGLKDFLKEYFLPLNARIIDITGEGIYFKTIRIDSWSDHLNHLTVNIGDVPEFTILPSVSYISDLRRIDQFYVNKFTEQGLTGFLGASSDNIDLSGAGASGLTVLNSIYPNSIISYSNFVESPYDIHGNFIAPIDNTWDYMPPSINNLVFNDIARRLDPLPDTDGIPVGAPILLEAFFDMSWEEGSFNWSQMGILGPSGAPINVNIWTWESIGRGQYIDCRWTIEKTGLHPFFYDTGRKPISDYTVETRGATLFSIPAKMRVTGMSGSSITSVQITNPGYGYTSLPSVSVIGTTGVNASVEITLLEGGYITGGTVTSGGSGYAHSYDSFGATVYPSVIIESPIPTYEISNRTLHAVSLPYEGEYQIGLYMYDMTNNFTIQFNKHTVNTRNVDFVSVHRKETQERTWEDFGTPMPDSYPDHLSFGELPSSGSRLVEWDEVTGPWYYPIHVFSTWDDAKISWESLNYSQFKDQTLFEEYLDTTVLEINREDEYVILSGDQLGIDVGDSLFFTRETSDTIQQNIIIPVDSIGATLNTTFNGITGSTIVTTSTSLVGVLQTNDRLWIGSWYDVKNVGSTCVELSTGLVTQQTSSSGLYHSSSNEINLYIGTYDMNPYSRLMITDNSDFSMIDPLCDYYCYVDGLVSSGGIVTVKGDQISVEKLIIMNSSLGNVSTLYTTWGLFAGTYSIEILSKSISGGNTRINLKDVNKELFYLDGNFVVSNADYDVDYAEYRIGINSLTYESADETTWEDAKPFSWFGLEYHGSIHCGFAIPFVAPGGSIRIDEYPSFQLSGDPTLLMTPGITAAKSALINAANELSISSNEGVKKFDYTVLPEDDLYMKTVAGLTATIVSSTTDGIIVSDHPDPLSFKIPVVLNVSLIGTSLSFMIGSSGYGYLFPPTVVIPSPDGSGSQASVVFGLINSQVEIISYDGGSGYTYIPDISVSYPENFHTGDNSIWSGNEWHVVIGYDYSTKNIILDDNITYPITSGFPLLLPYEYHKQLVNSDTLQQFYHFIHAQAVNPSSEMLCTVSMDNGMEGEWSQHPNRTHSYPLRNSILYGANRGTDYLYEKWEYEGSDYPPFSIPVEYSSDDQSLQSRVPYLQTLQSVYSFNDTVISNNQQTIPTFTPVVFNYDTCKIPGKRNQKWTIINEETGKIQAISLSKNFMWNFTKDGNYTVKLEIEDSNGNKSIGQKTSFIVIGKENKITQPLGRQYIRPTVGATTNNVSINILA